MIIDFHTHIFPPQVRAERGRYVRSEPGFACLYGSEKARLATAAELVDSMDRDGVDASVVCNFAWSSPAICRQTNDYILEAVAAYPKRLIGFGAVPVAFPDAALGEIERCARSGMRGIGELRLTKDFLSANSARVADIMAALASSDLILLLHCSEPVGHQYPGKGDTTPELLYPFISAFPGQKMVCAHWGGGLPFYGLMPEVKRALHNVYFDSAASPFLYSPDIYGRVSEIIGASRVLFGSDFPLLAQKRVVNEVRSAPLSDADKALILGENARQLLGIK